MQRQAPRTTNKKTETGTETAARKRGPTRGPPLAATSPEVGRFQAGPGKPREKLEAGASLSNHHKHSGKPANQPHLSASKATDRQATASLSATTKAKKPGFPHDPDQSDLSDDEMGRGNGRTALHPKTGPRSNAASPTRSAAGSVEDLVEKVAKLSASKNYYLVKDEEGPPDKRYKLVAEIYADKNMLRDLKPFIDSGIISKVSADQDSLGLGSTGGPQASQPKNKKGRNARKRSPETFPLHHYTKEIIDNGEFDNSFEEWLFDPIIRNGNHKERMQQSAKLKAEKELKQKMKKEVERPVTETYYLLNKKRLNLPDPHLSKAVSRKQGDPKHTLTAAKKSKRAHKADSSDSESRSKSKSKNSDTQQNNYFEEVEDEEGRGGSAGLREAARKKGVKNLNIADINAEHNEQILKSIQQHADRPPEPPKEKPVASVAPKTASQDFPKPGPAEERQAVASEPPKEPAKPSQAPPTDSLKPPEDVKQSAKPPQPNISKSPKASPKAVQPTAEAPREEKSEHAPNSHSSAEQPPQEDRSSALPVKREPPPFEKPAEKNSELKANPYLSKQQSNQAKSEAPDQKKDPSPSPSDAKADSQGVKSNPFLSKQQAQPQAASIGKPSPFTKQVQSQPNPAVDHQPKPNPGPSNKPAGGLAIKPFPGAPSKPAGASGPVAQANQANSPPDQPAASPEKAESGKVDNPSIGVKNNPFINKQTNKLAPADSKPLPPKSPSSDLKTSEKLKDNPFLKPKEPSPVPPAPPKSPRGTQDEKIKGLSGLWK